jgi:hypothetical protein
MVESENCRLRNALYDAAASLLIIRQQAERIEDSDDASEIRHLASSSHQSALEAIESPCEVFAQRIAQFERDNAALREAGHLAEKIIVQRTDEIRHLERENAALDWLNTHCMSAEPIMGRSTYRWTIEHDEPDIRAAIAELRKATPA